ncbi:hypothetical protein V1478_012478 [Vespula squamosa]|uniref:Uncharacterized protein n=1 Tax=Vespula squamosa TaxID=30214 RepID=A0ABD2ADC7_VESSQ
MNTILLAKSKRGFKREWKSTRRSSTSVWTMIGRMERCHPVPKLSRDGSLPCGKINRQDWIPKSRTA